PISAIKGTKILKSLTYFKNPDYIILIEAANHSIPLLFNMLLMVICFMYTGSIIGMWLFAGKLKFNETGDLDLENGISPRLNFDTLKESFTSIYVILQGDQYNNVWNDCVKSIGGLISHPYFIILLIIGRIIFQNAFVAIIIQSFDQAKKLKKLNQQSSQYDQQSNIYIILYINNKTKKGLITNGKQQDNRKQIIKINYSQNKKRLQKIIQFNSFQLQKRQKNKILQEQQTFDLIRQKFKLSFVLFYFKLQIQFLYIKKQQIINLIKYMKNSSCFIFHKDSQFRIKTKQLISNQYWDNSILILIILSSISLAIDNPLNDNNSALKIFLHNLDIFFTVIFYIEAFIKIIAQGFIFNYKQNKNAYLRNKWNILDLTILITSIIDLAEISQYKTLKSIQSLRALRVLRPLRLVQRNESLKLLVNSLFQTIPVLISFILSSGIVLWIISIFLVDKFKGGFYYCNLPQKELLGKVNTKEDCINQNGKWRNYFFNFDNIQNSIINMIKIMAGENWIPLMWASIDFVGIDKQPIIKNDYNYSILYFFLVYIGNIYGINLYRGLVVNKLNRIKYILFGQTNLSKIQQEWVDIQRFMINSRFKIKIPEPSLKYRRICYLIASNCKFEKVIMFSILINITVNAFYYRNIPEIGVYIINIFNISFLGIFHFECFIKIYGLGFYYFRDSWNKFDFLLLVLNDISQLIAFFIDLNFFYCLPIITSSLRLGKIVKY
ncbi:voltage-gated sodium channel alpha subunit isoform k, putative, partial [Ichthyophthirius multifiliis]